MLNTNLDETEQELLDWLENNKEADKRLVKDKLRQLREYRLNKYLNSIKTV